MPLLDDSEMLSDKTDSPGDKEKIELKEKSSTSSVAENEKDDSRTEKTASADDGEGGAVTEEPKKKKKGGHKRSASCVQTMTVGLNFLDRDEKHVNEHINIQFEDVLAEPDGGHSFEGVWRMAYVVFTGTKFWLYRLLAALCALPCALCWGINFACLSFCHIWAITPFLRVFDLFFYFIKRIWSAIVHTLCDPIFESVGMLFSNVRVHRRQYPAA